MKNLIAKIYAFAAIVACSFTYATEAEAITTTYVMSSSELNLGWDTNSSIPAYYAKQASNGDKIRFTYTKANNGCIRCLYNTSWNIMNFPEADQNKEWNVLSDANGNGTYDVTLTSNIISTITTQNYDVFYLAGANITITKVELVSSNGSILPEPTIIRSYTWEGTQALTSNGESFQIANSFLASLPAGEVSVDVKYNNNNQAGALSLKCGHCNEANYTINKELSANSNDQTVRFSFSAEKIAHFKSNAIEITGTNVTVKCIVFNVVRRYSESGKQEDFPLLGMRRIYTIASSAFTNLQPGATMTIDCTYNNEDGNYTAGEFGFVCNLEDWHSVNSLLGSIDKLYNGQQKSYVFTLNEAFLNHIKTNYNKGAGNIKVLGSNIIINKVTIADASSSSSEQGSQTGSSSNQTATNTPGITWSSDDRGKIVTLSDTTVTKVKNFKNDRWYVIGYNDGTTTTYLCDNNGTIGLVLLPTEGTTAAKWKKLLFNFVDPGVSGNGSWSTFNCFTAYRNKMSTNDAATPSIWNENAGQGISFYSNEEQAGLVITHLYSQLNNYAQCAIVSNGNLVSQTFDSSNWKNYDNWFAKEVIFSDSEVPYDPEEGNVLGGQTSLTNDGVAIPKSVFENIPANSILSVEYEASNWSNVSLKYANGNTIEFPEGSSFQAMPGERELDLTLTSAILNNIAQGNGDIKIYGSDCVIVRIFVTRARAAHDSHSQPSIYYEYAKEGTKVFFYSPKCNYTYATINGVKTKLTSLEEGTSYAYATTTSAEESTATISSVYCGATEIALTNSKTVPVLGTSQMAIDHVEYKNDFMTIDGVFKAVNDIPNPLNIKNGFDRYTGEDSGYGVHIDYFNGKLKMDFECYSGVNFVPQRMEFRLCRNNTNSSKSMNVYVNYDTSKCDTTNNTDNNVIHKTISNPVCVTDGWEVVNIDNIADKFVDNKISITLSTQHGGANTKFGISHIVLVGKPTDNRTSHDISISNNVSSLTLYEGFSKKLTVKSTTSNQVVAATSACNVATASAVDKDITINALKAGNASISLTIPGGNGYKETQKVINVTVLGRKAVSEAKTWIPKTFTNEGHNNGIYWDPEAGLCNDTNNNNNKSTLLAGFKVNSDSKILFDLPEHNYGGIVTITFGGREYGKTTSIKVNGTVLSHTTPSQKTYGSETSQQTVKITNSKSVVITKNDGESVITSISWMPFVFTDEEIVTMPIQDQNAFGTNSISMPVGYTLSNCNQFCGNPNWALGKSKNLFYIYPGNPSTLTVAKAGVAKIRVYGQTNNTSGSNAVLHISNCETNSCELAAGGTSPATVVDFVPSRSDYTTFDISVSENNACIYLEIYYYEEAGEYTRTLPSGARMGALCIPYAVAEEDIEGAVFYRVVSRRVVNGVPTHINLEKVDALEAGRPYIFYASVAGGTIRLQYSGSPVAQPQNDEVHGVYGTFDRFTFGEHDYSSDKFYVVNKVNQFQQASALTSITANKAYIIMDEVPTEGETTSSSAAPSLRIPIGDENNWSEEENFGNETCIEAKSTLSDEYYYSIDGRRKNAISNGLNIVNGKVILIK